MRRFDLAVVLVVLVTIGVVGRLVAAEPAPSPAPAQKVLVKTVIPEKDWRSYKVDVSIKGSMPNPDDKKPMDLNTSMSFKIGQTYSRRAAGGLLPVEIALLEGSVKVDDQMVRISPSIYPKLTVLLDKDFSINDIFGANNAPGSLPGINYGNLAMLFYWPAPVQARTVGDSWNSSVVIPALKEAYNVKNSVKAISKPETSPATITLRQEYVRVPMPKSTTPPPSMKATVESVFAQDTGKLLSSHAECEVLTGQPASDVDAKSQQDKTGYRANITVDVSLAK